MKFHVFLKTILLMALSFAAWPQTPVYVDVSQCRNISVDLVRVACYDKLADMALRQNGAAPLANQNQVPQAVTPGSYSDQMREKNRQMREELARMRKADSSAGSVAERADRIGSSDLRVATDEDGNDILYDRIQSLSRGPDGWIITLTSGQIWKQLYGRRYGLKEGQEVKITQGIMGSRYHLTVAELKSFIYVERLR